MDCNRIRISVCCWTVPLTWTLDSVTLKTFRSPESETWPFKHDSNLFVKRNNKNHLQRLTVNEKQREWTRERKSYFLIVSSLWAQINTPTHDPASILFNKTSGLLNLKLHCWYQQSVPPPQLPPYVTRRAVDWRFNLHVRVWICSGCVRVNLTNQIWTNIRLNDRQLIFRLQIFPKISTWAWQPWLLTFGEERVKPVFQNLHHHVLVCL